MMFGQNDDQQNNGVASPMPDSTLGQDNTASSTDNNAMGNLPAVPAAPEPASTNDSAGDYIMNDVPGAPASAAGSNSDGDLMSIKQQALQQLSPLLGHLDQTPKEKFRTTMMLIQASDNKNLIPQAYEAAKAIDDEKVRAQALLDVVNEINYFTQQSEGDDGQM